MNLPDGCPSERRKAGAHRIVWYVVAPLAFVAGLWWPATRVQSPTTRAARATLAAPSLVTSQARYEVLAERVIVRGDVRPSRGVAFSWTGGGGGATAPIVTRLPVKASENVIEGQAILEVSGRPAFAIAGDVPVYRDLRPGLSGRDVAQLQAALFRVGFSDVETDGVFGPGTKIAVLGLYERAGYTAPLTSPDASEKLNAAALAVIGAKERRSAAESALARSRRPQLRSVMLHAQATLGAATRSAASARIQAEVGVSQAVSTRSLALTDLEAAESSGDSRLIDVARLALSAADSAVRRASREGKDSITGADEAIVIAQAQLDELGAEPSTAAEETALADAIAAETAALAANAMLQATVGAIVPASELVVAPVLPARIDSVSAAIGERAEGVLLTMSADSYVVESRLSPAVRSLVRLGAEVQVDDDLSGRSYHGTVQSLAETLTVPMVGAVAGVLPGYEARFETEIPMDASLLGSNVRVTITGHSSEGEVLVVPAAAVFAQANGTNRVTVVSNGTEIGVTVVTGPSAGGLVAITRSEPLLNPGDHVVVGR